MNITEFFGKLHPVLVHLPIGIFILALLMEMLVRIPKFTSLENAIKFILLTGIISSILSLITGYLLSLDGSNDGSDLELHKWIAIVTTALFIVYYFLRDRFIGNKLVHSSSVVTLFMMLTVTGHFGGNLTHGADYLSLSPKKNTSDTAVVLNIENIDEAIVYKDLVQHTLNQKCVQCHGDQRQKGKLRLDNQEWIMAGGKNGNVINTSNPEKSELITRLFLDMNDELHMPPKEKEQLTDFEKTLLTWWVNSGASFDKKVADLKPDEKTMKALNAFKEKYSNKAKEAVVVRAEVPKITDIEKRELEKIGWVISPVSSKDNHIRVTGFNLEVPVNEALTVLNKFNKHVIELKLSYAGLKSTDLKSIAGFSELEKLWINNNKLDDKSVAELSSLPKLNYINLVETGITESGLRDVLKISTLKVVYTNKTGLTSEQINELKNNFKNIKFNFGADSMMKLESDTLFLKKI